MTTKRIYLILQATLLFSFFIFSTGCKKGNDGPITVSIAKTSSVGDGNSTSIAVTLSGTSGSTVKVNFTTSDGTAAAGQDYAATTDSVVFAPGQKSQTINVRTYLSGTTTSGSKTFTVTLSGSSNATLGNASSTVTINYGPLSTSSYYIFGTVDGQHWEADGLQSLTAYYNDYPTEIAGTGGEWLGANYASEASVTMELHTSYAPDANGFFAMLTPGSYGFVTPSIQSGAAITFVDNAGVTWSSYGDQTGSSFTITSAPTPQPGAFEAVFSGKFSCKLYDTNGHVKTLTNGYFNSLAGLSY